MAIHAYRYLNQRKPLLILSVILMGSCLFACTQEPGDYSNLIDIKGTPKAIKTIRVEVSKTDTVKISDLTFTTMRANTWNKNGQLLTTYFYPVGLSSSGTIYNFFYDSKGRLAIEENLTSDGQLAYKYWFMQHNNAGQPTETKLMIGDGADSLVAIYLPHKTITHGFARGKRITVEITTYKDGFIESIYMAGLEEAEYEGDEEENPNRQVELSVNTWDYQYLSFDKKGNWTRRVVKENGSECPCYLESRIIYYE